MTSLPGTPLRSSAVLAASLAFATLLTFCGSDEGTGGNGGDDSGATSDDNTNDDGSGGDVAQFPDAAPVETGPDTSDYACDGCPPFPPIGSPECDPQTLGKSTLVYPLDGQLLPPNMNVLEVQWVPPQGATLFEVDFENGVTDVRVETTCNAITSVRGAANLGCGLTLAQVEWNDIANKNRDGDPLKVTVRATAKNLNCVTTSPQSVAISFAKEDLAGAIYYWQSATYGGTAGKTGGIFSHDFGTFDPTPTPFYTSGGSGTCVGCHTLSRDGARISLMTDDPDADDEYGDVKMHVMDVASRSVIGGNNVSPGFQTFTHDHAKMIASNWKQQNASFTVWNGDGTTLLATDTLTNIKGTQPNLSKDDKTLVFVVPAAGTISNFGDHHFTGGSIWSAAFDATGNGLSSFTSVLAAGSSQNFYYPDQSSDGSWILFNENDDTSAADNDGDAFYSRRARVKILHFPPQPGDKPLDLPALNVADGLSNSWPRWSPFVQSYKNKHILWVTFSSNRDYGLHLKNTIDGWPQGSPMEGGNPKMSFDNYYPPESPQYDQPQPASKNNITFDAYATPQIWMAAIVVDADRTLDSSDRSYPAFWLPFQDVTAHNHSAQWVEKAQSPPPGGDGGTDSGADSGGCNEAGGSCGSSGGTCCSDVVCCLNVCQYTCTQ